MGHLRIAVVGMGASGVLTVIHLVRRLVDDLDAPEVTLHIFDGSGELGKGLAYSTTADVHLLNMRARSMSLLEDEPYDFVDFLVAAGHRQDVESAQDAYLPRSIYGEYLQVRLGEALSLASSRGIETITHREDVVEVSEVETCMRLVTGSGACDHYDRVILCPGHVTGTPPSWAENHPRVIWSPWNLHRYEEIDSSWRVGIVGAGLTAVDIIATLHAHGHSGPIHCLSRKSELPRIQPPKAKTVEIDRDALARLTERRSLSLDQIATGVASAMGRPHATLDELLNVTRCMRRREDREESFARGVESARNGGGIRGATLETIGRDTPDLWRAFSPEAKRRFLRVYYSMWMTDRHRMPLANGELLLRLQQSGQLSASVGFREIIPRATQDGFAVSYEEVGQTMLTEFDLLINATGSMYSQETLASPLLRHGFNNGQLSPDPLGGVVVDFETLGVIDPSGAVSSKLFLVGPLTRGTHFYANAIETTRVNVANLTASALGSMRSGFDHNLMVA